MQDNLLRFNYNQKYLVWDCETEGLNLIQSRPWQISWLVAKGDKILSQHDHFIAWKDLNISEDAKRITGFSEEKYLRKAEDPAEVFEKFSSFLYNPEYISVGQNLLGFDVYIVNVWRDLLGLKPDYEYLKRLIDTKSISTAILKKIPVDRENFLAWQYKLLNHREKGVRTSQATMLKYFDIPHDSKKLHDAAYDVEMTFRIFRKQIFSIDI